LFTSPEDAFQWWLTQRSLERSLLGWAWLAVTSVQRLIWQRVWIKFGDSEFCFRNNSVGKTWTKLGAGIPDTRFVRVVCEDPKKRGLLYAGSEQGVLVWFNDGANWRPLKLDLPTTPVHDLVVKDNDLVVATHGRARPFSPWTPAAPMPPLPKRNSAN
jgi:hypothetical protein